MQAEFCCMAQPKLRVLIAGYLATSTFISTAWLRADNIPKKATGSAMHSIEVRPHVSFQDTRSSLLAGADFCHRAFPYAPMLPLEQQSSLSDRRKAMRLIGVCVQVQAHILTSSLCRKWASISSRVSNRNRYATMQVLSCKISDDAGAHWPVLTRRSYLKCELIFSRRQSCVSRCSVVF